MATVSGFPPKAPMWLLANRIASCWARSPLLLLIAPSLRWIGRNPSAFGQPNEYTYWLGKIAVGRSQVRLKGQ